MACKLDKIIENIRIWSWCNCQILVQRFSIYDIVGYCSSYLPATNYGWFWICFLLNFQTAFWSRWIHLIVLVRVHEISSNLIHEWFVAHAFFIKSAKDRQLSQGFKTKMSAKDFPSAKAEDKQIVLNIILQGSEFSRHARTLPVCLRSPIASFCLIIFLFALQGLPKRANVNKYWNTLSSHIHSESI